MFISVKDFEILLNYLEIRQSYAVRHIIYQLNLLSLEGQLISSDLVMGFGDYRRHAVKRFIVQCCS